MYLVCDGGYLWWPQLMCPYVSAAAASAKGYFLSNLESVRKDVECTSGITKKRRKILNNGLLVSQHQGVQKNIRYMCLFAQYAHKRHENEPFGHPCGKGCTAWEGWDLS